MFFDFDLLEQHFDEARSNEGAPASEEVKSLVATLPAASPQSEEKIAIKSVETQGEDKNQDSLIGVWFYQHGQFSYEIQPASSLWKRNDGQRLNYVETLSSGIILKGLLEPSTNKEWNWEARFDGGGCVRLRCSDSEIVSCYLPCSAGEWEPIQHARRANAFAFYNANAHPEGYRYVSLVDRPVLSSSDFPLCGYSACWLPAMIVRDSGMDTTVRLAGTFSDPFDIIPPGCIRYSVNLPDVLHSKGKGRPAKPGPSWIAQGQKYSSAGPAQRNMIAPKAPQPKPKIGWHSAPKGASKGKTKVPLPAFEAPTWNPLQQVAASLGCSTQELWEKGSFRGKLRKLPKKPSIARNLELKLPSSSVLRASEEPSRPLLSILCVRWYDYWSDPQKCSDYSTLNDGFFTDLFDGPLSVGQLLPGQYEVFTVFVQSTKDFGKLDPGYLRSRLRGVNIVAWYFIWPSFDQSAGFVSEQDFFQFLQAMERIPIRTAWPHESQMYRILCGKLWIPQMCLNRDFRVPPTTRLHYADFRHHGRKAIVNVLRHLMLIRKKIWGKEEVPVAEFKGVVKLGFSWGGFDVLPFKGIDDLSAKCQKLFEQPKQENIVCLVQEMIPSVVAEHRVVCIHDRRKGTFRKEPMWMTSFKATTTRLGGDTGTVQDFVLASSNVIPSSEVTSRIFAGDRIAQTQVESQASLLASKWLTWYQTETTEPPQCTRIDFLVTHPCRGRAEAWTCEVGECGASLCSVEVHGRNLAALNNAILEDESGRFPILLPNPLPRNSGWKS